MDSCPARAESPVCDGVPMLSIRKKSKPHIHSSDDNLVKSKAALGRLLKIAKDNPDCATSSLILNTKAKLEKNVLINLPADHRIRRTINRARAPVGRELVDKNRDSSLWADSYTMTTDKQRFLLY